MRHREREREREREGEGEREREQRSPKLTKLLSKDTQMPCRFQEAVLFLYCRSGLGLSFFSSSQKGIGPLRGPGMWLVKSLFRGTDGSVSDGLELTPLLYFFWCVLGLFDFYKK